MRGRIARNQPNPSNPLPLPPRPLHPSRAGGRRRLLERPGGQGRLPRGQGAGREEEDRGPAARRPLPDRGTAVLVGRRRKQGVGVFLVLLDVCAWKFFSWRGNRRRRAGAQRARDRVLFLRFCIDREIHVRHSTSSGGWAVGRVVYRAYAGSSGAPHEDCLVYSGPGERVQQPNNQRDQREERITINPSTFACKQHVLCCKRHLAHSSIAGVD